MPPNPKQTYFNEIARLWDTLPGPDQVESRIRELVAQCTRSPVLGWILDVGCGTGILVPALLEQHPFPSRILEMDFAFSMLRVNLAKYGAWPRIFHACADVQQIPLQDASIELVVCFGLFPHLPDPDSALREFLRVLKPGGVLAIGHLMASDELNAFHASLDGPVAGDRLPPAEELARRLSELGATDIQASESPGFYLVRAFKRGL